jgi:hypothetical protein
MAEAEDIADCGWNADPLTSATRGSGGPAHRFGNQGDRDQRCERKPRQGEERKASRIGRVLREQSRLTAQPVELAVGDQHAVVAYCDGPTSNTLRSATQVRPWFRLDGRAPLRPVVQAFVDTARRVASAMCPS